MIFAEAFYSPCLFSIVSYEKIWFIARFSCQPLRNTPVVTDFCKNNADFRFGC